MIKKYFLVLLSGIIPALFLNSISPQAINYSQSSNITTKIITSNKEKISITYFCSLNEDIVRFCPLLDEPRTYCYLEGEVLNTPKEMIENKQVQNANDNSSAKAKEESPSTQGQPQPKQQPYSPQISRGGSLTTTQSISMTTDERYWLEKLIEAESADEPYEGKLAVANIIANRVGDIEFSSTVNGVIRADNQFSPWKDGSIYKRVASDDSKRAVREIFDNGMRILPKDAMFFVSQSVKGDWITDTRKFILSIGGHKFFSKLKK